MNPITQHLNKKGMPFVWQLLMLLVALISLATPLFSQHQDLVYGILLITHPILFFGVYAGFRSHKEKRIPRLVLALGVSLITIAQSFQHLSFFEVAINYNLSLFIEEVGIIMITVFAYIHILMFEKKFNIKGFAIDYTLLIISAIFLGLLIIPNLIQTIFYSFNFYQQIVVFNFCIGMTILTMSVIHFLLTRSIGLTDGVRIILTILLVISFAQEIVLSFDRVSNPHLINSLTLSVYHLAGALAVVFIFIEDLNLDFSEAPPTRIGNLFMWISSSFAILAIPLGIVVRSFLEVPAIDLLTIGLPSILISVVVIWRILILIKNSNRQKESLNSLMKTNSVTGLPNYQGYLEQFTLAEIQNVLLIHLNIEDFKSINDLYGRDIGDKVLNSLAQKLQHLPESLFAAHIQSDQFLVAFHTKEDEIKNLVETIQSHLGSSEFIDGNNIAVPLTIGIRYRAMS